MIFLILLTSLFKIVKVKVNMRVRKRTMLICDEEEFSSSVVSDCEN